MKSGEKRGENSRLIDSMPLETRRVTTALSRVKWWVQRKGGKTHLEASVMVIGGRSICSTSVVLRRGATGRRISRGSCSGSNRPTVVGGGAEGLAGAPAGGGGVTGRPLPSPLPPTPLDCADDVIVAADAATTGVASDAGGIADAPLASAASVSITAAAAPSSLLAPAARVTPASTTTITK